jgi:Inner membrane protein YgaP-like, transmembrane domain
MDEEPIDRIVLITIGSALLAFATGVLGDTFALVEGAIAIGIGAVGVTLVLSGLMSQCPA